MKTNHSQELLLVFTRYPEPGKTKTRLVPALGADGAADLHRRLTENSMQRFVELQQKRPVEIEVCFDGGDQGLMREWLGPGYRYIPQGSGDLGQRMSRAFASAFAAGKKRVLVVGADCPDLSAELLATALDLLETKDLVLGPAMDGGYYLIGLRQMKPDLFLDIKWGTNSVLNSTLARAARLGLSVGLLAVLSDIDRPQDLAVLPAKLK